MTLANIDYEIEYLVMLIITLYFTDAAWFGHKTTAPKQDLEIGYATILTWVRATGFMGLSCFFWFFMAELTVALNSAIGLGIITDFIYICVGLFFLHLVMTIVMVLYLVLPTERIPKAFQYFAKQRAEGYNDEPR